ncbi:hypothetical protein D3C76_1823850 [compost metagenome]
MPLVVEFEASVGAALTVEPGVHRYQIDVPTHGIYQGPVQAEVFAFKFHFAGTFILITLIESIDIPL